MKIAQTKFNEIVFIILFVAIYVFMSQKYLGDKQQAAFGIVALAPLALLYFFKSENIHKFSIIYVASVLLFFSPLGVKFPRYLMPALPIIYLMVGQMISDLRKYKIFFLVALVVVAIFAYINFGDTVSKLVIDKNINDVKYGAQKYVNDNSLQCSRVYSKTWYGFYYLRTRIGDLPSDTNNLQGIIKSSCSCPPKYFVSEGNLDSKFSGSDMLEKVKEYSATVTYPKFDWKGFRYEQTVLIPIEIWQIKNSTISSLCSVI
jgi:hypothetical protein